MKIFIRRKYMNKRLGLPDMRKKLQVSQNKEPKFHQGLPHCDLLSVKLTPKLRSPENFNFFAEQDIDKKHYLPHLITLADCIGDTGVHGTTLQIWALNCIIRKHRLFQPCKTNTLFKVLVRMLWLEKRGVTTKKKKKKSWRNWKSFVAFQVKNGYSCGNYFLKSIIFIEPSCLLCQSKWNATTEKNSIIHFFFPVISQENHLYQLPRPKRRK